MIDLACATPGCDDAVDTILEGNALCISCVIVENETWMLTARLRSAIRMEMANPGITDEELGLRETSDIGRIHCLTHYFVDHFCCENRS